MAGQSTCDLLFPIPAFHNLPCHSVRGSLVIMAGTTLSGMDGLMNGLGPLSDAGETISSGKNLRPKPSMHRPARRSRWCRCRLPI